MLTITGTCWAVGSWLQSGRRLQQRTTSRQRLTLGFALIMVGCLTLLTLPLRAQIPLALPYAGWALAGVGIGIASPTLAVTRLALTPQSEQGRGAAASSLLNATSGSSAVIVLGMLLGRISIEQVPRGGQLMLLVIAAICVVGSVTAGRISAPPVRDRVKAGASP